MVVLMMEKVPARLRGELTRWMLEPKTGVFVGDLSGMVRDRLWEKTCQEVKAGGAILVQSAANEQGFVIHTTGDTSRVVADFEGLALVRIPQLGQVPPAGERTPAAHSVPAGALTYDLSAGKAITI